MPWIDCLGFAAALSVVASFCMTTIIALRAFALFSNVLFIFYGAFGHIHPVLCLHVILLPVNVAKLYRLLHRTPWAPSGRSVRIPLDMKRSVPNDASHDRPM